MNATLKAVNHYNFGEKQNRIFFIDSPLPRWDTKLSIRFSEPNRQTSNRFSLCISVTIPEDGCTQLCYGFEMSGRGSKDKLFMTWYSSTLK